jgi:LemA protein
MSIVAFVFLGMMLIAVLYAISIYNALVALKHAVTKAWSNIDVILRQRHDELPKLVETCKQYMAHERNTLEKVMAARAAVASARDIGNIAKLGPAESALRAGLGQLFAIAEAYPNLKADQTFRNLEARISALEDAIADRREFYNESVNLNNVRIEQFPDVIIARFFGFKSCELLEFSEAEKADVNIQDLFGKAV